MATPTAPPSTWTRYLQWRWHDARAVPGVELDLADAAMDEDGFRGPPGDALASALAAMDRLEAGALANADEGRAVGHYWLRDPKLTTNPGPDAAIDMAGISAAIEESWRAIDRFTTQVHDGTLRGADGERFDRVIQVGIGGSALGPQLVCDALAPDQPRAAFHVLDNTDPAGIRRTLGGIGSLGRTLALVVSKSGSTVETRNAMLELQQAFRDQGLPFARHAVAITGPGSKLDALASDPADPWLARFPLWSWVGGRTSVCSPVGLLPMALLGLDWRAFLAGAAAMDAATRARPARANPATLMARFWHDQTGGAARRAMVVLPYRDRLVLLSRYLQQLVMESLGKRLDRAGAEVWQGLTVFGNKGSTDQHAYVQQLRDGPADFFAVFVRVLEDAAPGAGPGLIVDPERDATSGDCLDGFYQGTRRALSERGRASATIAVDRLDARALGSLVALFERTVGVYAELVDINAYHQPGVEAGKVAARGVLALQHRVLGALTDAGAKAATAPELAARLDADPFSVWQILRRLALTRGDITREGSGDPGSDRFRHAERA